ncbi:MAG: ROK family transcriptional regulator [Anaerolineae bacterium]|nr:ROK family transcriptional regulator [Anaerolineae bacterium]
MFPRQQSANHNLMRNINRALILRHLRHAAPLSRAELAQRTGLTRSTVSSLVDELRDAQMIHETGIAPSRGGRPGTQLELNPAGGCAVGVEITGDSALVMLADFTAQPRWQQAFDLATTDPDTVLPQIETLIDTALHTHAAGKPLGIGLGIAGLVNAETGVLTASANLGWRAIPFRERWITRYRLPVHVGNEASIAALGEHHFGAAQDHSDFVYLGITRTAIGAGLFINGALYQGINGYAGEVGHMQHDPAGPVCACGKRGCWEALLRAALEDTALDHPAVQARVVEVISAGVANLINTFNPQLVVLGGPVGRVLETALPEIQAQVAQQITMPQESSAAITTTQITSNACALGALALVLDDVMNDSVR